MKIRVFPPLSVAVVLLMAVAGFAQTPRVVRWEQGRADSRQYVRPVPLIKRLAVKELTVDGVTVSASILDGFRVNLTVTNGGAQPLDLRPDAVSLAVTRPGLKYLSWQSPDMLARNAEAAAHHRAAHVEMSGAMATKTVVETTTTWSDTSITGLPNSPSEPPRLVTNTTVTTMPDDDARWRARNEAESIRARAGFDSQSVLRHALRPARLDPRASASGAVFFERDKGAQEIILSVPFGHLTFEFPFQVKKKRVFLLFNFLYFE